MEEYERVKKEAKKIIRETVLVSAFDVRGVELHNVSKAVKKILSLVEIKSADQSLPEKEFISSNENYRYAEAQQDMLKPDSEGRVWVKVEPKKGE